MQIDDSSIGIPYLEDAIDKHPLVVEPDATLGDIVTLMSQTRGNSCFVSSVDREVSIGAMDGARSSCVLVMLDTDLLGIFTERDIVRLTAAGTDFATVKIAEVMAHPVITLSKKSFQDIFAALFLFRRYRIRHLVIINESQEMVGVVTPESIRRVLRPSNLLKMRRVSEIMSANVIHAPPTATVLSIAEMMATHRVSCVVIVKTDTFQGILSAFKPVGIITERDIVQYQALGLSLGTTEAKVVMSTPLFLLDPDDSLWFAHQEMQRRRVQRLVVSWDWGAKLGIVTQSSLLRIFDPVEMYGVVETLQQTIVQLENQKAEVFSLEGSSQVSQIENGTELEKKGIVADEDGEILANLLADVTNQLEYLLKNPDLTADVKQTYLKSALTTVERIRNLSGQN